MLHEITHLVSGHPVTYLVVLAISCLDVLCPLLPAETVVIGAGVIAARGGLALELLIPAAALGGFLGDNIAYQLGCRVGDPVAKRLFRGDKGRRRLESAERAIQRHGVVLIVIARFLPGGRTATTFGAGTLALPWRRFATGDAPAALAWGAYASLLGFLGGASFQHSMWKPLVIAIAVGVVLGALAEGYRRFQRRRGRDLLGDSMPGQQRRSPT